MSLEGTVWAPFFQVVDFAGWCLPTHPLVMCHREVRRDLLRLLEMQWSRGWNLGPWV
jgi:hypothetical protein